MSVINSVSTKQISRLSAYAMGIGSELNMKEVAKPKGMLEHLVNIFTLGGVRRDKEEFYKSVISELRTLLHDNKATTDSLQHLEKLELHLNKMDIILRPDNRCNAKAMHITVSRGSEKAESLVPISNFKELCASIILREDLELSRDNDLLMPDGKFNLSDITDSKLKYEKVVEKLQALPEALRRNLPEDIQKSLEYKNKHSLSKYSDFKYSYPAEHNSAITAAESKTDNNSVLFIESRKISESDLGPATGYSSSTHSDSDTLRNNFLPEGDNAGDPTIYHNVRSHKDLSVKVS